MEKIQCKTIENYVVDFLIKMGYNIQVKRGVT